MDISSPLKPDVFRVVTVIVLPGLLTVAPWLAWFWWPEMLLTATWKDAGIASAITLLAASVIAGMIIEDIGAHIEVSVVDRHVRRHFKVPESTFDEEWLTYLFSTAQDRFVAHRYIRAMVTRLKFELSMIPACLAAALALLMAAILEIGFPRSLSLPMLLCSLAIAAVMLDQAKKGGRQLYLIRQELCRRELSLPPSQAQQSAFASGPTNNQLTP